MSNIFQSIAKNSNIRQSGALPAVMARAEQPQQPKTSAYEGMIGGIETAWVIILTTSPVEHQAVAAHLEPFGQDPCLSEETHKRGTIYTTGKFATSSCNWKVAVFEIDIGSDSAAIEATRAIEYFHPTVILSVGTAGGIKDVEIGDVVAASVVYDYECGKVLNDRTLPRPRLGEADYNLKQRAQAEARKDDWRRRIRPGLTSAEKIPKTSVSPIAAGSKVIRSRQSDVYQYLQEYYDDAIAVEMEGFGLLKATQQVKNVSAIVIRGISNLIGRNVNSLEPENIRQDRAARHASAFAFEILAKLEGNVSSQTFQAPLDYSFPPDVAILYVEEIDGELSIEAFNSIQKSLEPLATCPPPPICLPQFLTCSQGSEVLGELLNYKPKICAIGQFFGWFIALRKRLDADSNSKLSHLIINDRTDFEIPWEMLNLPGKETLGTATQIVRWHDIQDPETWEPIPPHTSERHCCQGDILIHANAQDFDNAYRGIQALQVYQHIHLADSQSLFDRLQQTQAEFGLIFIASRELQCLTRGTLAARLNYTGAIGNRASVAFIDLQSFPDDRPTMNYRELATSFLEYGLKGVVGTLKTVDEREAAQIVQSFFTEHNRDRAATIPELLRRLRFDANRQLRETFSEEACLLYLSTCMYAYYGNQMTVLELTPLGDTP
jgi:nucleoside phosphorylase